MNSTGKLSIKKKDTDQGGIYMTWENYLIQSVYVN